MENLSGYVEHIVYRNPDNGYTVFVISSAEIEEMTCVGLFSFINEGTYLEMEGDYTNHNVYGQQFSVKQFKVSEPADEESIIRYLSSGAIKCVGETLAKRIVGKFGLETLDIIAKQPERLAEIKGISERIAMIIYKQFEEQRDMRDAMLYLGKYGISTNLAVKIYNTYGERMREVLTSNPYKLAEDIKGVGFIQADDIAAKLGIERDSEFRIRAGFLHALAEGCSKGNAYLPENLLVDYTAKLLGCDPSVFSQIMVELSMARKIITKNIDGINRVYLTSYYYTELAIARMLHDLNIHENATETEINSHVTAVEKSMGITLDTLQRQALVKSYTDALLIITGGPGTGKTTIINGLISMYEKQGLSVLLAAPTGRAAKRMSEATGHEASTIHRLLEFMPSGDDDIESIGFQRNDDNPLEADVIIIDEASMIDMHLMNALLKAILVGTRVIFAGDARQLPSVGPGNVLSDIIESGAFSVVKLETIFRQAKESDIIVNAHKINNGEHPVIDNKSKDFFILRRDNPEMIRDAVVQLVRDKLPGYVKATSFDVQVLTPMRKGELGVERFNQALQAAINPSNPKKKEKEHAGRIFREGDKVMQIKNDYQLEWKIYNKYNIPVANGMGIFNGDLGVVKEIDLFAELMTVVFDENKQVDYNFSDLDELDHAYAVTVHKSQGSEYPAVVLPLLSGPRPLMNRNLLYTAVTRAAKCVTIVGVDAVVNQMVDNEDENRRYTGLKECIKEMI